MVNGTPQEYWLDNVYYFNELVWRCAAEINANATPSDDLFCVAGGKKTSLQPTSFPLKARGLTDMSGYVYLAKRYKVRKLIEDVE